MVINAILIYSLGLSFSLWQNFNFKHILYIAMAVQIDKNHFIRIK